MPEERTDLMPLFPNSTIITIKWRAIQCLVLVLQPLRVQCQRLSACLRETVLQA